MAAVKQGRKLGLDRMKKKESNKRSIWWRRVKKKVRKRVNEVCLLIIATY